jgi:hypothetical protein
MTVATAQFEQCSPTPWHGRYARIPGDCTAFHRLQLDGCL